MAYSQSDIEASFYGYVPNLPANLVALIVFAILLVVHLGVGLYFKQWVFAITWSVGLALQVIGYAGRVVSHFELDNLSAYLMQQVVLVVSPSLFLLAIYYQLAKLVTIYGHEFSFLPPMKQSLMFIIFDRVSIIVQAAGSGVAASGVSTNNATLATAGKWVAVAGLIVQNCTTVVFVFLVISFMMRVCRASEQGYSPKWAHIRQRPAFKFLVPSMLVSTMFIFIRSIFRLVEIAEGFGNNLARTERYFLVLDTLMVFFAVLAMTLVHPGFALSSEKIPVAGGALGGSQDINPEVGASSLEKHYSS